MIPIYALCFFFINFFLLLFNPFWGQYLGWRAEIPAYFVPFSALFLAFFPALYFGWIEEKNRERLEQLADRLRRLYKRAGQPALHPQPSVALSPDVHRRSQALPRQYGSAPLAAGRDRREIEEPWSIPWVKGRFRGTGSPGRSQLWRGGPTLSGSYLIRTIFCTHET